MLLHNWRQTELTWKQNWEFEKKIYRKFEILPNSSINWKKMSWEFFSLKTEFFHRYSFFCLDRKYVMNWSCSSLSFRVEIVLKIELIVFSVTLYQRWKTKSSCLFSYNHVALKIFKMSSLKLWILLYNLNCEIRSMWWWYLIQRDNQI